MEKTIGFIGGGSMGGAMIHGMIGANLVSGEQIIVADLNDTGLNQLKEKFNVRITKDNVMAARESDILFLAVKPNVFPRVIGEIKDEIKEDTLIVSIAAGQTIENIQGMFGREVKLIRTMPNTPALVGEGMSALCPDRKVSAEEIKEVKEIFESFGKAQIVEEGLMETVIGVSGSSPAYAFMFIEALADAGVLGGMQRAQAYEFAAQSILGAAKMVLETKRHPGELKDMVCSPGGTTITAVAELEKQGLRKTVIKGAVACMDKAKEMKENNKKQEK